MERVRTNLRHPVRFLLSAACLGTAFWALMGLGSRLSYALNSPEMKMFVLDPDPVILTSFVLTSMSVAWLLRAPIAHADLGSAVRLSLASSVLGGALYMLFFFVGALVFKEEASEGLGTILLGTISGVLLGAVFSLGFLPVTLPLGWVSILLLRRASGGLMEAPAPSAA